MKLKPIKRKQIVITGGIIPITLSEDEDEFVIDIDGIEWVRTQNPPHAIVLFELMAEHITEYMHYEMRN